jgi:uncharacterized NAD(P)/FAD-binding protein YdhS
VNFVFAIIRYERLSKVMVAMGGITAAKRNVMRECEEQGNEWHSFAMDSLEPLVTWWHYLFRFRK